MAFVSVVHANPHVEHMTKSGASTPYLGTKQEYLTVNLMSNLLSIEIFIYRLLKNFWTAFDFTFLIWQQIHPAIDLISTQGSNFVFW